ncbi:MAG: hypothetical protein U0234_22990 [Sandaracinus sp.]
MSQRTTLSAIVLGLALAVPGAALAQTGSTDTGATTSSTGGTTSSGAGTSGSASSSSGSTGTGSSASSSSGYSSTSSSSTGHTSASTPLASTGTSAPPPPAGAGTAPPPEEEDEGDGRDVDFLWIEAFGGVANVNLVAFNGAGTFSGTSTDGTSTSVFDEVTGTGPMVGAALGFRVYWIAVGARFNYASYDVFQIGTVGGEVALRLPIPVVEPYARVGFGYAWQGDANYAVTTGGVTARPSTTVYGWAFNAALGLDIFLANWFTIGAGVGLDVLNMGRQTDPSMTCMGVTDFCPSKPGDAVGYQISGFGQIGFHF